MSWPLANPAGPSTAIESLYLRFPVDRLIDNSVTDFDLFAHVGTHVILYSGNGYKWMRSELSGLINNGYKHLYIRPEDTSKAAIYEKMAKLPEIAKNLKPEDRLQKIQDIITAGCWLRLHDALELCCTNPHSPPLEPGWISRVLDNVDIYRIFTCTIYAFFAMANLTRD